MTAEQVLKKFLEDYMSAEKVLQELNESPYVYFCYVREDIVLPLKLGDAEARVGKNRKTGMLEVTFKSKVFFFEWDNENKKWVVPKPQEVSAC